MFEYFPGNYVWNLGVVATLNSGGLIDEVDRACRPIRDAAAQGEDAGTPDFLRAWTALDRPARRPGRGGREGRAHPHRRAAVLPGHELPVPGRADAVASPTRTACPTYRRVLELAQKAFDLHGPAGHPGRDPLRGHDAAGLLQRRRRPPTTAPPR